MGTGIPPNIKTSNNMAIMPAIINGIKNRKIASAIMAMKAITSKDSVDPLKGSMSITTSNMDFKARIIGIISYQECGE